MLASINVGRVRFPDDEGGGDHRLSHYYHLNTTRLCQGHTSHEHGASRFAYLDTWTRKFLFRNSNRMSLALQKGELLRSRLSTDALSLASWLNVPRISAFDPHARGLISSPRGSIPQDQDFLHTPSPEYPGP